MAVPSRFRDGLAQRYYSQFLAAARSRPLPSSQGTASSSQVIPNLGFTNWTAPSPSPASPQVSSDEDAAYANLPDYLKHPSNPFSWGLSQIANPKSLTRQLPGIGSLVSTVVNDAGDDNTSIGKIVDVLSQPLYSAVQTGVEDASKINEKGVLKGIASSFSPVGGLGLGSNLGSKNAKVTPSDLLRGEVGDKLTTAKDSDVSTGVVNALNKPGLLGENANDSSGQKTLKAFGGFAADILGDPLTYVPGGAIKAVASAPIKGALAATRAVADTAEGASALGRGAAKITSDVDKFTKAIDGAQFERKTQQLTRQANRAQRAGNETKFAKISDELSAHLLSKPQEIAEKIDAMPEASVAPEAITDEARLLPQEVTPVAEEAAIKPLSKAAQKREAVARGVVGKQALAYNNETGKIEGLWDDINSREQLKRPKYAEGQNISDELFPIKNTTEETTIRIPKQKATEAPVAAKAAAKQIPSREQFQNAILATQREKLPVPVQVAHGVITGDFGALPIEQRRMGNIVASGKARPGTSLHTHAQQVLDNYFGKSYESYVKRAREAGGATRDVAPQEAARAARTAEYETRTLRRTVASRSRLTDPQQIQSWVQQHAFLDADEVKSLLDAPTYASFARKRAGILKRTVSDGKKWQKVFTDVYDSTKIGPVEAVMADNVFDAAKEGLETADEITQRVLAHPSNAADMAKIQQIREGAGLDNATAKALHDAMGQDLWDKFAPENAQYPFETAQGTKRTAQQIGEGYGVNREGFNRMSQMNLFASLVREGSKVIKASGEVLNADRRARRMASYVYPRLRAAEDFLLANGIYTTASTSKVGMPLTLTQMLDALNVTRQGREILAQRVFTAFAPGSGRAGTNFAGSVDVDALLAIGNDIAKTVAKPVQNAEDVTRAIEASAKKLTGSKTVSESVRSNLTGEVRYHTPDGDIVKTREIRQGGKPVSPADSKAVVAAVTEAFTDPGVIHSILQNVHNNAASAGIQFARNVEPIAEETMQTVLSRLNDLSGANNLADKVDSLLNPRRVAKDAKATHDNWRAATKEVVDAAGTKAATDMTEVIPDIDLENASFTKSITDAEGPKVPQAGLRPSQNMNKKAQEKYESNGKASTDESTLPEMLDQSAVDDTAYQTGIFRMLDPLARTFVAHYGNATFREAIEKSGILTGVLAQAFRRSLNDLNKSFQDLAAKQGLVSRDVAKQAWRAAANGTWDTLDPEMKSVTLALRDQIDKIFETGVNHEGAKPVMSTLNREGMDLKRAMDFMDDPKYGLPPKARFVVGDKMTISDISGQWRNWDIDDPLDFLAKMQSITTRLATEQGTAREFWRVAKDHGLISSTNARSGGNFVRMKAGDLISKKPGSRQKISSVLTRYFETNDQGYFFIDRDALQQLRRMDQMLADGDRSNAFTQWAGRNLDPFLHAWKAGMTIYNPGHHVRNMVGDLSSTFLADGAKVSSPEYLYKAMKMVAQKQNKLGRGFRGDYGEWDALAALQGVSRDSEKARQILDDFGGANAQFSKPAAKVKVGDKTYNLQDSAVFRAAMDRGALPDFNKEEDLFDSSDVVNKSWAQKIASKKPAGGRLRKGVGKFTEGRDDLIRLSHFMGLLENGIDGQGWKAGTSLDEIFDKAAARVRYVHPDGSRLTPFEQKYMRRMMPFYSWNRLAIPMVLTSMAMHPGRAQAYPKAMYNAAEAQGIDLDSLSDPFPEDQLFPKFITDNMTGVSFRGPNGHYFTVDPGFVQADVLNSFFAGGPAGSLKGAANMLSPLIKDPIELGTGKSVTGVPITDKSEYIDQQIPFVGKIASIFGISPTGTAANVATGIPAVDQLRAVEKDNRGGITDNPEYFANYLLNAGILDASKPSYQNLAEIEQRDKIGKQQSRWQGDR